MPLAYGCHVPPDSSWTIPCVPTTIAPCDIAATPLRSSTVTSNALIERARSSTSSTAPIPAYPRGSAASPPRGGTGARDDAGSGAFSDGAGFSDVGTFSDGGAFVGSVGFSEGRSGGGGVSAITSPRGDGSARQWEGACRTARPGHAARP